MKLTDEIMSPGVLSDEWEEEWVGEWEDDPEIDEPILQAEWDEAHRMNSDG